MLRCVLDDACEFEHEEEHEEEHDSKDHIGLKMGLLAGIFFEALIGGVLPFFIVKSVESADPVVSALNAPSGGFLTAGLTHILPHVIESSAEVDHGDYPLPYALVIIGYLLVFLVEKVLFHTHAHDTHDHDHDAHEHEHHGHGHGHEKKGRGARARRARGGPRPQPSPAPWCSSSPSPPRHPGGRDAGPADRVRQRHHHRRRDHLAQGARRVQHGHQVHAQRLGFQNLRGVDRALRGA